MPNRNDDQAWFWTKEWQRGEQEADEDIRLGFISGPIRNPPEFKEALQHNADKPRRRRLRRS